MILITKQLKIDIPHELDEDEIEGYFHDNVEDLYSALDLELPDDRAQVDDVQITEFELTDDSVHIEYNVEFSAYYGCDDANYADSDQRSVSGRRDGSTLIFDIFVPPPRRDTVDEF
ncbi:hypothetical protein BCL69_10555 [Nitrosomonas communis]|uniref:Uncharacterized protein n=1 Tax=Nitrosomonas communis TaxID=44574 RepID=A0A0F7KGC3_9PROT|nr:hypothetical protein AAW31_11235 [Nitrosomonas communis]TYP80659.1 hypothetical protein BCL69_10555 [Nitrosomonas communis]